MTQNAKERSILNQYFSNYFVVVLLICLMTLSVGVFFVAQQQEQREAEANRLRIRQIQLVMDSRLEQCLSITGKLASNRAFLAKNNQLAQPSRETMLELQKYFQPDIAADLLLIYSDDSIPFFYSPVGSMSLAGFDSFYQMSSLPIARLKEYARTLNTPTLLRTLCYRTQTPYYAYLAPLSAFGAEALTVFLIPEADVLSICSTPFDNADHALLMTSSQKPALLVAGELEQADIDRLTATEENVVALSAGRTAFGTSSRLVDYRYWVVLSHASATLATIMNMLLVGVSVLLVGILLAYRMAHRTYLPLGDIMKRLNLPTSGNEFESIGSFISMLQNDRKQYEKETRVVERHAYSLLLTGGYATMEREELLELLQLPPDTVEYALVLLHPTGAPSAETAALLRRNEGWDRAVAFDLQDDSFILLAAREHAPFAAACQALPDVLARLEPERQIVASPTFADILTAQSVLYQLRYGLRYQYVRHDRVIRLDELPQASQPDLECNLMFLGLYQYLLDKSFTLAREQGHRILQYLQEHFTPELQTLILWNFTAVLNNYNNERLGSGEFKHFCSRLLQTRQDSIQATCTSLDQIFDQIEAQNEKQGSPLSPEIVRACILQHYTDASFSLQGLADAFGVSSPTISRYIKTSFGCTLTEYLTTLRIEKAKELLAGSDIPVSQIVSLCGYNDVNNFYRRFCAVVGITPAAYRAEHAAPEARQP